MCQIFFGTKVIPKEKRHEIPEEFHAVFLEETTFEGQVMTGQQTNTLITYPPKKKIAGLIKGLLTIWCPEKGPKMKPFFRLRGGTWSWGGTLVD